MPREPKPTSTFVRRSIAFLIGSIATIASCVGSSSDEATAEEALVAINEAHQTCGDVVEEANQCLSGLKACIESSTRGEDFEACTAELEGCVPPPPPSMEGSGDCPKHNGDQPPPPDGQTDGQPPPPPDGQPPPPDGHPRPGHHGMGNPCHPGGPIVAPCVDDLKACLSTSTDPAGCFDAAEACLDTAIETKLKAMCDRAQATCAAGGESEQACADIAAKCASPTAP